MKAKVALGEIIETFYRRDLRSTQRKPSKLNSENRRAADGLLANTVHMRRWISSLGAVCIMCTACGQAGTVAGPSGQILQSTVSETPTPASPTVSLACCGSISTTAAKVVGVGEPVPWTWQLGTGTTTVDQIFWANATHQPMAPELLSVQVTVEALTGEADFDIETFSAMTADGRELRPDAAEHPTGDTELNWSRFPAGQSYQGWVTFTVPYGPTEVYFTILGERLAIFPAPISETSTAPTN